MKQIGLSILTALAVLAAGSPAPAQVAGTATVGVTVAEMKEVMLGWSAKKQFLGKPLYNDKGEKVGSIDDVIIGPDKTSVSYVIVGAGGFAGLGKHDVAIPVSQIKQEGGKFVLPGATKEVVKALPKFEYAKAAPAK